MLLEVRNMNSDMATAIEAVVVTSLNVKIQTVLLIYAVRATSTYLLLWQ